jgi:hypothetical protein
MTIGWPAAIVLVAVIFGAVTLLATRMAAKAGIAGEETKGKYGEQYRMLADDYQKLAQETRDAQSAMQTDVASLKTAVESIEKMMREVA